MLPLNDSNYLSVVNKGIVVIDFMADWCQPCKPVGENLALFEAKYKHILFVKVNVDQAPNMAAAYHVGSIPTVLFMLEGVPATVLIGSKCTLTNIKKILDTL